MGVRFATVVVFSFFSVSVSAVQPMCDESVLPTCTQLDRAPIDASRAADLKVTPAKTGASLFNPNAFFTALDAAKKQPDPYLNQQLAKISEPSETQKKKALALIDTLRKKAAAMIAAEADHACAKRKSKNQTCGTLLQEKALLTQRLTTMNVQVLDNADNDCVAIGNRAGYPEGGYLKESHALRICPAALSLSDEQIVSFFSHEIGHVVDTCGESMGLYKVDRSRLQQRDFSDCDDSLKPDEVSTTPAVEAQDASVMSKVDGSMAVLDPSRSSTQKLRSCKILTAVPGSSVSQPILFEPTSTCLQKTYSSNYRSFIQDRALEIATTSGSTTSTAAQQARSETPTSCLTIEREHFADSFASRLIGQMATRPAPSKKWTAADYRSALLYQRGSQCRQLETAGAAFNDADYPAFSTRIATLLNDPAAANALGCQPKQDAALCPLKFAEEATDAGNPTGAVKSGSTLKSSGAQ